MVLQLQSDAPPSDTVAMDECLRERIRAYGVHVVLIRCNDGVIVQGVSRTFYGKQMAQELLRQANVNILTNQIRVERC
jgi:hypothetical protein